jgi:hypothetical protein
MLCVGVGDDKPDPIGFERQKTFRPADIRARKRTFDRENDRFERRKTNFAEKIRGRKTPK